MVFKDTSIAVSLGKLYEEVGLSVVVSSFKDTRKR